MQVHFDTRMFIINKGPISRLYSVLITNQTKNFFKHIE